MKCPRCSNNHKYKDGMTCTCGYAFALNPKQDFITDGKFLGLIRAASANDTLFFTENQLYTAACRKMNGAPLLEIAGLILLVIVICVMFPSATGVAIVVLIVVAILILTFRRVALKRKKFDGWLAKFSTAHGVPEKLITEPKLYVPPPQWNEADIFDYGAECVIVVQHDILVDLLIKNGLHASNRGIVISSQNYPDYIAVRTDVILAESPELPVFLLHDATDEGKNWRDHNLTSERWNNGQRDVIDVGLNPEDLHRIKRIEPLKLPKNEPSAPLDCLPMALLVTGLSLAIEQQTPMSLLLNDHASTDSSASFG